MDIDNIKIVKTVAKFAVGSGTTKIVNDIIANNVNTETTYRKVTVAAAAVFIGLMAADKTKEYTDTKIDGIIDEAKNFRTQLKKATEEK